MKWNQAYILHRYPFQDSSLLVKLWTQECGLLSAVINGVRKAKSRRAGICQPFIPLQVTLSGRGEVMTVRQIETLHPAMLMRGNSLAVGFYLNELLLTFLHPHLVMPALYQSYQQTLQAQCGGVNSLALREFEITLMNELGYDMVLDHDEHGEAIVADQYYRCRPESLPQRVMNGREAIVGSVLQALALQQWHEPGVLSAAKQLCRTWISHYSHGKTFQSRQLWRVPS